FSYVIIYSFIFSMRSILLLFFTLFPYTTLFRSIDYRFCSRCCRFINRVIYGGISGYFGGMTDNILQRIIEVLMGIPQLVIIILRSEEHTSELQSRFDLVCRLLLEKKKISN